MVEQNHQPTRGVQTVLFFFDEDWDSKHEPSFVALLQDLAGKRAWSVGPPSLIDVTDHSSMTQSEDEPIRTFGGTLKLLAPYSATGEALDRSVEQFQLDECEFLIRELAAFSRRTDIEIGFELDGTSIGFVTKGRLNATLAQGFLGEWKGHIATR